MSRDQNVQHSPLPFLRDFNKQHRRNARIICVASMFVLTLFAFWDVHAMGADHPAIAELLLIRFLITTPLFIFTYYSSCLTAPMVRLDILMTISILTACLSIVVMHWKYFQLDQVLAIDSILLCLVATYFLPNIFSWQKLVIGICILAAYFTYLFITQQAINAFIHSGIYLLSINIAGLIHSLSFDKERRANYDKTQFLETMARTDQLTGTENRHKFDERFVELLEQGRIENQGIAIAIVDIDYFKQYNDHYGHFAGDECLIKVAQALLTLKRHPVDTCIRFGGEEFILIRYGISFEETPLWGQKIINTIYDLNIPHAYSDAEQRITISAGVIHWHPTSSLARTQLMTFADHALYKAKSNGRNQVHIHLQKEK
ncbi:MAG: GGDEF domain-containing protein [Bermanella sp.]